jgi:hypothetical protein
VAEKLAQYTVDVSGVFDLPAPLMNGRLQPYVSGGIGYLRQLHEGRLLVETGRTAHVSGGVRYWLRRVPNRRLALGVRAEARYLRRSGGIEFEDEARGLAALRVLGMVAF